MTRLEEKLIARRRVTGKGCWEFTGNPKAGYGKVKIDGQQITAHKAAWAIWVGPVPEGKKIGHRCGNGLCFNPEHLFAGTHKEIVQQAIKDGKLKPRKREGWHWSQKMKTLEDVDYVEACRARYKYRSYE